MQCKFVTNSTEEGNFLQHCRKMVQIRCHKGAGTKMKIQLMSDIFHLTMKKLCLLWNLFETFVWIHVIEDLVLIL